MINTMHLVARKRVPHTAQFMKEASTDTRHLWFVKRGGHGVWSGLNAQSEPAAQGIVLQPMTL